ncbi:MAG TPA: cupin domain-containing protein [Methylomirabilota bacterium]|jgi:anti-sigma factor ChrR (cupin superfamily)
MTSSAVGSMVVQSGDRAWRPSRTPGVSVKVLRSDEATGESTALIKFEAGTRFPAHDHPGGEEIFVLEGDLSVGPDRLRAGDYLFTPPHGKHAATSDGGCVFLVTLPRPVVIIERGGGT